LWVLVGLFELDPCAELGVVGGWYVEVGVGGTGIDVDVEM